MRRIVFMDRRVFRIQRRVKQSCQQSRKEKSQGGSGVSGWKLLDHVPRVWPSGNGAQTLAHFLSSCSRVSSPGETDLLSFVGPTSWRREEGPLQAVAPGSQERGKSSSPEGTQVLLPKQGEGMPGSLYLPRGVTKSPRSDSCKHLATRAVWVKTQLCSLL